MKRSACEYGIDKIGIAEQTHGEYGTIFWECVHGVEHFDGDEHTKWECGGLLFSPGEIVTRVLRKVVLAKVARVEVGPACTFRPVR